MKKNKDKNKPTEASSKPWKDKKGNRLPLAELRAVAQTWEETGDIWKDFLRAIEAPLRVELVDDFDSLLSKYAQEQADRSDLDAAERAERERVFEKLDQAIKELPKLERALIQAVYWDGVSLRDMARAFKMNPRTIFKRHKGAIELLRQKMCTTTPSNRGVPFLEEKPDSKNAKDNDIKDVYAELTGVCP